MEELISQGLTQMGLPFPPDAPAQMARYAAALLEKNQVMNLTAITDPEQVARLHFLDSAALVNCLGGKGLHMIDVGTGAGFPGLPLKLLRPELDVTLLDSLGKRVTWLEEVCASLGLSGIRCLHARAEEQALEPGFRDSFDVATSRAVADLRLLCELCLPYVKVGGRLLAMKAVDCDEEVSTAAAGIRLLGGKVLSPYDYTIPGTDVTHRVVIIEKIAPTPKGYPRRWAKIQKAPL